VAQKCRTLISIKKLVARRITANIAKLPELVLVHIRRPAMSQTQE
jgi:hypothetical protein